MEEVLSRFEEAWRSGRNPRAEDWLDQLNASQPTEASELIYLEFCLAEEDRRAPKPDEFLRRFPAHEACLSRLFGMHHLFGQADVKSIPLEEILPGVGDSVGPFHLIRKLGKGSFAIVYLAEQDDLACRYVVVKLSTRPTPEASLLARAEHSHIVPVQRSEETREGLQLIVMPFLGGETLQEIARAVRRQLPLPTTGRGLLERLDEVGAKEFPKAEVSRPARELMESLSFNKAIAWMFARLAEALAFAAEKGVMHGDIKPSNILMTADGVPMLFDFNLAVDSLMSSSFVGGTAAYMPPERLMAIHRARDNEEAEVGGAPLNLERSDIYALGLVMVELLTGRSPFVASGSAKQQAEARSKRLSVFPDWELLPIPTTLRPILEQCLASDPSDRYADGKTLAEDLDRWRMDLPPMHSPDAGILPRVLRWVRRKRFLVATFILTVISAIGAGAVLSSGHQTSLDEAAKTYYDEFVDKRESELFGSRPFAQWGDSGNPVDVASRKLSRYQVIENAGWRENDLVTHLSVDQRAELELLMLEQVCRLCTAYLKSDSEAFWRKGLDLVEREWMRVPADALGHLRTALQNKLGVDPAKSAGPNADAQVPAWVELYLKGVEAESMEAQKASEFYDQAHASRPELLWPLYRYAAAATRVSLISQSEDKLEAAVALRPKNAALRTHHALALFRLNKTSAAMEEFRHAIEIDPNYLHAREEQAFVAALCAESGTNPKELEEFRKMMAGIDSAVGEKLALRQLGWQGLMQGFPAEMEAARDKLVRRLSGRDLVASLVARKEFARKLGIAGKLDEAIAAYDEIIQDYPDDISVRYYRLNFLRKRDSAGRLPETLALLKDPRFHELYRTDPGAILLFLDTSRELLGAKRRDEAIALARRGLAIAHHYRMGVEYFEFAVGEALASDLVNALPGEISEAKERLRRALRANPVGMKDWYAESSYLVEFRGKYKTFLDSLEE